MKYFYLKKESFRARSAGIRKIGKSGIRKIEKSGLGRLLSAWGAAVWRGHRSDSLELSGGATEVTHFGSLGTPGKPTLSIGKIFSIILSSVGVSVCGCGCVLVWLCVGVAVWVWLFGGAVVSVFFT